MRSLTGLLAALSVLFGLAQSPALADDKTLTIFAATSLKNALDDIDAALAKTGVKVVSSYAASSVLAQQIEQDGPVDIFASADTDWMDYAFQKKTEGNDPRQLAQQLPCAYRTEDFLDRRGDD